MDIHHLTGFVQTEKGERMSRLIDADAFIDEINKRIKEAHKWYDATQSDEVKVRAEQAIATFCEASLTAKRMPTVKERKTGKWIVSDDKYWHTCPFCNADIDVSMGTGIFVNNDEVSHMNYCPHCGSYNGGDEDD